MNKKRYYNASKGFTIIEVLVVMVIIGILATLVVPTIMDRPNDARVLKAKTDIAAISTALKMYKLDNGFYPTTEQGLGALITAPTTEPMPMSWKPSGYLSEKEVPKDPWGSNYIYRSPGDEGEDFVIISLGADRKEGGTKYEADILSTKLNQ